MSLSHPPYQPLARTVSENIPEHVLGNVPQLAKPRLDEAFANVRDATMETAADTSDMVNDAINQLKATYKKEAETAELAEWLSGYGFEFHMSLLFSLLFALVFLLLTTWYMAGPGAEFTSESGHLAALIPLFMILGESIVRKALAVTTASPRNESPLFGFGWLSYSLSTLVPALSGTRDLLPKPEIECKVLNLSSGQGRQNNSFLLSRVLRDLEFEYAPEAGGLTVEILEANNSVAPLSLTARVRTEFNIMAILVVQLFAVIFTYKVTGDMSTLFLFTSATFLRGTIVKLPAWKAQKFSARKDGGKNAVYALMRGNGHRYVFIVKNTHKDAWNLEDLAGAAVPQYDYCRTFEGPVLVLMFLSFLVFTYLSTLLSDQAAASVLAIMTIGTVGNVLTAALPRKPWAHGITLRSIEVINDDRKVMSTLQQLEEKYPGFGSPLVKEFFPGGMSKDQLEWWAAVKERSLERMGSAAGLEKIPAATAMEDSTKTTASKEL